ncbi:hypothetical protein AAG906_016495 [Vitis piasezkii]
MAASQGHGRNGLKKSPWTPKEDQKLIRYMKRHGEPTRWTEVPKLARLNRCGKSCRLRWSQYLKPGIKRGNFSQDEEDTIIRLQSAHGNRWVFIATQLPGRTDSEIKNYWNTGLKKKLAKKEIPLAYALRLHSDARLPNPQRHGVGFISTDPTGAFLLKDLVSIIRLWRTQQHRYNRYSRLLIVVQQGFGDITPDPEAQLHGVGSISTDAAGLSRSRTRPVWSFDYQYSKYGVLIPDPKVNNNYAADLGSLFGNVPNAGSTPALMVSESSERSMTNQVENEMTPPTEEISLWKPG